eukprot:TRINITY_DN3652_c0_g1_i3.p1 TRINITY_DN3652_c0_g1~~TRINITY_DN3652_c0_g1_i3.p1  ORF type:complete len:353 (+),score=5.46 TRINITY_DN3652_c0_g1_i3:433-1491(+)
MIHIPVTFSLHPLQLDNTSLVLRVCSIASGLMYCCGAFASDPLSRVSGTCGDACAGDYDCNKHTCPYCNPYGKCSAGICGDYCWGDYSCSKGCPRCSLDGRCAGGSYPPCGTPCESQGQCGGECAYCRDNQCSKGDFIGCGSQCLTDSNCANSTDGCTFCAFGQCASAPASACGRPCQSGCYGECEFCGSDGFCTDVAPSACGNVCSSSAQCFGECATCNPSSGTCTGSSNNSTCGSVCDTSGDCGDVCYSCNRFGVCDKGAYLCGDDCKTSSDCIGPCTECIFGVCTLSGAGCQVKCDSNAECTASQCSYCSPLAKVCVPGKVCGFQCEVDSDCNQAGLCAACKDGVCTQR